MNSGALKYVPFLIIAFVLILFLFERFFPLRKRKRSLFKRLRVNAFFIASVLIVAFLVVRPISEYILNITDVKGMGLLNWIPLPVFLKVIVAFLLLDLAFYYWHLLNHKVPLLWRFHNVHHIDPDLDVSTAYRFHFVEIFYSSGFRAVQILIIGVSPMTYIVYELFFQLSTAFHHSNIRIPIKIERIINYIIVTPRMHGIHHSAVKNETNSNYSTIFRWWDLLHRSLRLNVHQNNINIGVPAYLYEEDNKLWHAIKMPFVKQRNYWKASDGSVLESRVQESVKEENRLIG